MWGNDDWNLKFFSDSDCFSKRFYLRDPPVRLKVCPIDLRSTAKAVRRLQWSRWRLHAARNPAPTATRNPKCGREISRGKEWRGRMSRLPAPSQEESSSQELRRAAPACTSSR